MKKALLLTLVMLCCASLAFAQGGSIGIFMDDAGTNCNLTDTGTLFISFVHLFSPGSRGSQFKVTMPGAYVFLADQNQYPVVIGSVVSGISVTYGGACPVSPILAHRAIYTGVGGTPPCTPVTPVGHPTATPPGLLAVDCGFNSVDMGALTSLINTDGSCPCEVVPAEDTTWGQVKALYQ